MLPDYITLLDNTKDGGCVKGESVWAFALNSRLKTKDRLRRAGRRDAVMNMEE